MRVSDKWLKELVDIEASVEEIAECMGFPIDMVEELAKS